ncbi:hypothetical protein BJY01DRAFT_228823 [Aspergillus pseudoustus]|uniref:N-acetyltransferase domain-containing protein n=1 Tax=Aspergillus pseudoustus TaxID=1810923 RepID=A0ABR4IJW4_9EURO
MACTLVPINLGDPSEYEELRIQRVACGWDNTPEKLDQWREKQTEGLKSFFWITKTKPTPEPGPEPEPGASSSTPTTTIIRAGHISLDAFTSPPNDEVANAAKTNLTIKTFFIMPAHRAGGLGSAAMRLVESLATSAPYGSPNCEFITLDCLSKAHYYDPVLGPYVRRVMPICNQEWYERMGYVVWKVEPRYEDRVVLENGESRDIVYDAAFMRKRVAKE